MNKYKDILIVSDIDGTLLSYEGEIHPRNIKAIETFIGLGGNFGVATGRTDKTIGNVKDKIPTNVPGVVSNGACLYDLKENIFIDEYCYYLGEEEIDVLKDIIHHYPTIGVEIITKEHLYLVKSNALVDKHLNYAHLVYKSATLEEVLKSGQKWMKVLIADCPEKIEHLHDNLEKQYVNCNFVRSANTYCEIIPKNINKYVGLKNLGTLLNISMENTYAVGDYYNDLQLLKGAKYSAAVEGAPEEVKRAADIVVADCKEGGVADFIYHVMEKIEKEQEKK